MPTIDIPDIWIATPKSINALPLALRKYIRALQRDDSPEDLRLSIYWLEEANDEYRREIDRLRRLLRKAGLEPGPSKKIAGRN
jgi:hypothetical protein